MPDDITIAQTENEVLGVTPHYFTARAAAEYLSMSKSTFLRFSIFAGIPYFHTGNGKRNCKRWSRTEIDKAIKKITETPPSTAEIEAELRGERP